MLRFLGRFRLLALVLPFIPGGAIVEGAAVAADGASVLSSIVKFFRTPVGKCVAVALVGAALYVAGDLHRGHRDAVKWAAMVKEADNARTARDAAIRQEMTASAQARTAEIQREADELKQRVTDYENAPSGDACRATADHARRLRGL